MGFGFRELTEEDVVVLRAWHYEPPYDTYDGSAEPEDLPRPGEGDGSTVWLAASQPGSDLLVGFVEIKLADDEIEIGLGLRPDLTGRGLGPGFVTTIVEEIRSRWGARRIGLDVFPWNERAIAAYERAGFDRGDVYVRTFPDGAERTFLRMIYAGA
jgi:ribosomal-protein-alanine N-acetyltransferase